MARMTHQFLKSRGPIREYDTQRVEMLPHKMYHEEHADENCVCLELRAGYFAGRQYVYLGKQEAQTLSAYFQAGRGKPPVRVSIPSASSESTS